MQDTDRDRLDFDFSPAHCSERERLWEERGLSNRFPVSTAQSLRHHSIVCFTTQFFRHCLAARIPPLCRFLSADDGPEKEINHPGFEISVDIVLLFFSAASLRSSHLVYFGSFDPCSHRHPCPLLQYNRPLLSPNVNVFLE